ncbi:ATP-binding cassette domain-containing protein [Candidatus Bathyarchaeota archaeon]|nr:ATP-binding cassette domain-containing protein [Candidatus Bathyarchaeota archaeon]
MLDIQDLVVHYDGALALNRVSLKVNEGEFVGVVGPNGAGKTTLLRAISGVLTEIEPGKKEKPSLSGTIEFNGKRIEKSKAWNIVKMGIIHCPERRRPFSEMTTLENLMMGAYLIKDTKEIKKDLEWVYKLFPILRERAEQMSQTLSGGEQQMLAIGRALMGKPKLLLIDEPSLGLAPMLKATVLECIKEIWRSGVTILLVEQDVAITLDSAQRIYVLAHGQVAVQGTKEELMKDRDVREVYLGL